LTVSAPTDQTHPVRQVLILSLAPAIGMGFARFAYALVLPDMRDSLHWSYAMAGFMNTVNSAGYLAGALSAAMVARHLGLFRTVMTGTILCAISLLICAASGNFFIFSLGRLLGGVSAAVAFVSGGALATAIAQAHVGRSGLLIGIYAAGPGTGLIISGLIAPFMLQGFGPGSWWIVWSALAAISALMTILIWRVPMTAKVAPEAKVASRVPFRPMALFLAAYGMFGAGYIAYITFMLAYVRDAGGSAAAQSAFWCLIGLGAVTSPWVWRSQMARGQSGRTLGILLVLMVIATLFARFGQSPLWLGISALLFGSAAISIGASTITFARFNYPPEAWPKVIAVMTITFSIGQTLGPSITGAITDAMGSLAYALNVSVAALAIGAVFAMLQKPLARSAVTSATP
jgi:predicted MFS family arabinose efflux permease